MWLKGSGCAAGACDRRLFLQDSRTLGADIAAHGVGIVCCVARVVAKE